MQPANQRDHGRPFGGTALFLRKGQFTNVDTILLEDFTTVVKTLHRNRTLTIFGVYLQSLSQPIQKSIDIYKTQLATITGALNQFTDISEPIILGDFQTCPDKPLTQRTAQPNTLSKYLSQFIVENNLIPIDITQGQGPTYTYHHLTMPNKSYIDHVLIPTSLSDFVFDTSVLPPDALNTGDHLPVDITFNFPPGTKRSDNESKENDCVFDSSIPNYMWKNKKFISLYQQHVSSIIETKANASSNADSMLNELHTILQNSATECYLKFVKTSHSFPSKPWWNDELRKARLNLQTMFNSWRQNNFPRDSSDISYNRYKFARKIFRNQVKHAKHQATVNHYINVEKLKKVHPSKYWDEINFLKKKQHKLYTINGKTNSDDIVSEFGTHFDKLLNSPRVDHIDNSKTNGKLKELLDDVQKSIVVGEFYVTKSEVLNATKKLKTGKSRDPFQLKAEHYIYAQSDSFISYLTTLINKILASENIPEVLSTSIIIPLVKSYKKSLNNPNNYRGISILPIITKLLELVILERCPEIKNHINSQYGFTSGSSTLHAELILQETIQYYNKGDTPVYICSLDAEKAFDCVNWLTLFEKLREKDFPREIISFLIQFYLNGTATVVYLSGESSQFTLSQGVRQGAILSPYMYNIYTEDFISHIKALQIGTSLPNGLQTCIIVYADDIILLSPTLKNLQTLLDHCASYGKEHGLKFNQSKTKTQFVISGPSKISSPTLTLNDCQISQQDTLTHLGFQWSKKKSHLCLKNHRDTRVAELWSVATSLIASGIRNCHPNTIVSIYNTIVVPKLLYGLELVELTKTEMEYLDSQARACLKTLFNISKRSKNDIHRLYSIPNVCSIIDERRLNLLRQLVCNKSTKSYVCFLLSTHMNMEFSFINKCERIIDQNDLSLTEAVFGKRPHIIQCSDQLPPHISEKYIDYIENWHVYDNRVAFKAMLEEHVIRARTGI